MNPEAAELKCWQDGFLAGQQKTARRLHLQAAVQPVGCPHPLQESCITEEEGFEAAEQRLALKLLHRLQEDFVQNFMPAACIHVRPEPLGEGKRNKLVGGYGLSLWGDTCTSELRDGHAGLPVRAAYATSVSSRQRMAAMLCRTWPAGQGVCRIPRYYPSSSVS